jgi:hypothetical protein
MDKIINILKSWVEINLTELKTGRSPHVSFIISKVVEHPTSRSLIKDLSPYDILKLCYVIFFLFEGYSMEESKRKSEKIKLVVIDDINEITNNVVECEYCYGNGQKECGECDGDGEIECYYCDGTGEVEGNNGETEGCTNCDSSGRRDCGWCDGESEIECHECDGDGRTETDDEVVEPLRYYWTFTNVNLFNECKKLYDNQEDVSEKFYDLTNSSGGDVTIISSFTVSPILLEEYPIDNVQPNSEFIIDLENKLSDSFKESLTIKKAGNNYRLSLSYPINLI